MNHFNQWIKNALQGETRLAIPIMTHPGIELCGKTVKEAVTNGAIHAEAICKLNEIYPASASTAIMDLTVEAEAFGAEIDFPEDDVPNVVQPLVSNTETVRNLSVPSLDSGRIQEYLKADRLVAQAITDKPVFAGCIGPFSLAARLYGMSEIMIAMFMEPDTVHLLLDKCTEFMMEYCRAIKETGVNGVIMADPVAGLISNEDCDTYSSPYIQRIVKEVQDDNFLLVLHNCGNGGHCTEAMIHSGAGALHFGNKIDMLKALEDSPKDMLVMGNLDPVGLFQQAPADKMYEATLQLLKKTATYPNFVLSSGCDVPPHIPSANIEAFYQALKDYSN